MAKPESQVSDTDATSSPRNQESISQAVAAPTVHSEIGPKNVQAAPGARAAATTVDSPGDKSGAIIVGRYKLLQQIGEGGMGTVWMAEQQQPVRRMVALKLIKAGLDSGEVLARFDAERQALAMMDHPNIAKVLDAGTSESGRPYFVMELVKGVVITRYCDEKRLTLRQRLELMIPVCQAVQHAHNKGIIHRDLKPSNVLVANYDGRMVPKVIDFGLAKATGRHLTDKTLFTGFGVVLGTLEYMSPEQAELNALDVDTRSDIYSLGVLLYELLTGTTPITREKMRQAAVFEVLRIIREEEPPMPSTRLSQSQKTQDGVVGRLDRARLVRGDLDWIVMKALEKDRDRRYETANNLAQDIERHLKDEPVLAGPPSTGYRLRKFVKRNRGPVLAAAVVLLTVLGGIVGTTWGLFEAQHQRDDAVEARRTAVNERDRADTEKDAANKLRQKAEEDKAIADKLHLQAEQEKLAAELARKDEAEWRLFATEHRKLSEFARINADKERKRAEKGEDEARKQLALNQSTLFTAQIGTAAGLWQSDPGEAKTLLRDLQNCPPQLRDFTWHLHHRMCERERTEFPDLDFHQSEYDVCTALSPDAKVLAAGGALGTIQLWDFASGKLLHKFVKHKGRIDAVCFTGDGKTLMAAETLPAADKTWVHRWDVASGNILGSKEFSAKVKSLALHPGGKWMVTGNYQDDPKSNDPNKRLTRGEAILWNLETGERKELLHDHPSGILATLGKWSPLSQCSMSPRLWVAPATGTGR